MKSWAESPWKHQVPIHQIVVFFFQISHISCSLDGKLKKFFIKSILDFCFIKLILSIISSSFEKPTSRCLMKLVLLNKKSRPVHLDTAILD